MASLATTYYALGRYEEDEKMSREVLARRREFLGEKHPETVQSMAELAATYHELGRYDEAREDVGGSAGSTAADSRRESSSWSANHA